MIKNIKNEYNIVIVNIFFLVFNNLKSKKALKRNGISARLIVIEIVSG
jgi:hypothetical protein